MTHSLDDCASRAGATRTAPAVRSGQLAIDPLNGKLAWIAAAVICAAYVAYFATLTSLPMQDYANHVARADVMADLLFHHGSRFGQYFEVHLRAVPYVLPDLILMSLVQICGLNVGTAIFTGLVLLCLPCALLFYAHVKNVEPRARLFVLLVSLYLSTDWFFLAGFMAFRLSLALIVVCLALAEMLRGRWSIPVFATYIAVLLLGFLTHLTAPVFLGVALSVSVLVHLLFRTASVRREIYLSAPVLVLGALYFGLSAGSHPGVAFLDYSWAGSGAGHAVVRKIYNLKYEFIDFNWNLATPNVIVFASCMLLALRAVFNRPALRNPAVLEQLVLAAAFLGMYFVLPSRNANLMYVDVRALTMIPLTLLFARLALPHEDAAGQTIGSGFALGLATLLAVGNLAHLALSLSNSDAWISRYREVEASIPKGSYVLPIHTETHQPHLLHVASHVVLDRGAVIPYLFNGADGDPERYFRYKDEPYAPNPQWYRTQLHASKLATGAADATVDWNRVACTYDFLLITKPFDARFIGVPTVEVISNAAAALLAVDKRACDGVVPR